MLIRRAFNALKGVGTCRGFSLEPESPTYRCLHDALGFSSDELRSFDIDGKLSNAETPADTLIPGVWIAMQRHGLCDIEVFRTLCRKNFLFAFSPFSRIDSILQALEDYGVLKDTKAITDVFIEHPTILLREPMSMRRLLSTIQKAIRCEKPFIGELILKEPRILISRLDNTMKVVKDLHDRGMTGFKLFDQLMSEPRTLLLKASSLTGFFKLMKNCFHISSESTLRMLERHPSMVMQCLNDLMKKKFVELSNCGVPRIMQEEIMRREPLFYLK